MLAHLRDRRPSEDTQPQEHQRSSLANPRQPDEGARQLHAAGSRMGAGGPSSDWEPTVRFEPENLFDTSRVEVLLSKVCVAVQVRSELSSYPHTESHTLGVFV